MDDSIASLKPETIMIPVTNGDTTESEFKDNQTTSLWKEVYDNPGTSALAAGGTALAVGAILASRGVLSRFFAQEEVLLVTRSRFFGNAIKNVLEGHGKSVTWIAGAEHLSAFRSGFGLARNGSKVELHLDRYKAAFVDSWVTGDVTGVQIFERLAASRIRSVGMSTNENFNKFLLQNGAVAADRPGIVLTALYNRALTVGGVIKKPTAIQERHDRIAWQVDRRF